MHVGTRREVAYAGSMAPGRRRWSSKSLRRVFPLLGERLRRPRFDGVYVGSDGQRLRFSGDGGSHFDGERGTWRLDGGVLWVTTPRWQCEGALDAETAYLLCSPEGQLSERVELELRFASDADGGTTDAR